MILVKYGERLKKAREHAGLSQPQLAEKSGVNQRTISKLELGNQNASTKTTQLATACGVRVQWLAAEKGPMLDAGTQQETGGAMKDEVTEAIADISVRLQPEIRRVLLGVAIDLLVGPKGAEKKST